LTPGGSTTVEAWDPIHSPTAEHLHWSTVNAGEAVPGVQTPLSWTMWADGAELGPRRAAFAVGAFTRAESRLPTSVEGRLVRVFYGRCAIQCEVLGMLGDRLPGTTGEESVRSVLGHVPPDMAFQPTRRRYPVIAWRFPTTFLNLPRQVPTFVDEYEQWRQVSLERIPHLEMAELAALLSEARRRVTEGVAFQTTVLFGVVQPLFDALTRTVAHAGTGDVATLSGTGGAEMAVVTDIWAASRGRIPIETVVANHGFHGPLEGEISSTVWREDDTPLRRMIEQYAGRDDSADPAVVRGRQDADRRREQLAVLAALPPSRRPGARLLLALASERIPLRGMVKRCFVGALDVGRATARQLSEHLVDQGRLNDPDDVFYLTAHELSTGLPADAQDLVDRRRERHREYLQLTIPRDWTGTPVPLPAPVAVHEQIRTLAGIGVSSGIVEGIVRVVDDPAFAEVEPDEILVARLTDPSWSSIMFISAGLIVDTGGALSHAALVARELKIPCVVNTGNATISLHTGDRVRVDGDSGIIEVLSPSPAP
jgi:phosphohistidine swiveling domain-containing protein